MQISKQGEWRFLMRALMMMVLKWGLFNLRRQVFNFVHMVISNQTAGWLNIIYLWHNTAVSIALHWPLWHLLLYRLYFYVINLNQFVHFLFAHFVVIVSFHVSWSSYENQLTYCIWCSFLVFFIKLTWDKSSSLLQSMWYNSLSKEKKHS